MNAALAGLVFAPALAVGSFLNVVAARLPERRSLVHPRSACPRCEKRSRGMTTCPFSRTRSCVDGAGTAASRSASLPRRGARDRPPRRGLLLPLRPHRRGVRCRDLLRRRSSFSSAIDVERRILPDLIVLPATVIVLAANIALFPDRTLEWVLASLGAALFLFVALLAYPAGWAWAT